MRQYHELARHIMNNGVDRGDRTGTGTRSVFGYQMRFDLSEGFPLMTTKKTPFRLIAEELFWFLDGDTDVKTLIDKNIHIWTPDAYRDYMEKWKGTDKELTKEEFIEFAKKEGYDLGRIYGAQWRSWRTYLHHKNHVGNIVTEFEGTIDQIKTVIESIKNNPESRRHIVSAWNPSELDEMALPPCHTIFQFYVADGKLSCQLYQRSGDVFLGVPFNIASYALLTHLIAHVTGLEVGEFIHTLGDAHIYHNHFEQIQTQLQREPRELPTLTITKDTDDIFSISYEDLRIDGYDPHPPIKGKVSVG